MDVLTDNDDKKNYNINKNELRKKVGGCSPDTKMEYRKKEIREIM